MQLFRKRTIEELKGVSESQTMKKTLGASDLIFIGVGAIIGVGVFVVTGKAAALTAGPAVTLSYLLAGIICIFTALCYAELASLIPVSGGVYSYSYVVMGELAAWVIGCCVLMLYLFGAATVAGGWSGYVVGVCADAGFHIPEFLTKIPAEGGLINLPAVLVTMFLSLFLIAGTDSTTKLNNALVVVKVAVILLFWVTAAPHVDLKHFDNFMPYGFSGITTAAGTLFFAYAGFDVIATSAEECKNPNRDIPIGIIVSLLICITIYVVSALLLTAILPYDQLNTAEPMAYALRVNGSILGSRLVATGALAGMTTVLMMNVFGMSRVLFSMSRDGMLPSLFSKLHRKYSTPYNGILFTGILVSILSGFMPVEVVSNLTSMATLLSLLAVSIQVLVMRFKKPDLQRSFKCPAVFVVAPIAIISCIILIAQLLRGVGMQFIISMAICLLIYFSYGYWNSVVGKKNKGNMQ